MVPAPYLRIFDGEWLISTSTRRVTREHSMEHTWERQSEDVASPVRHGSGDRGKIPASFCNLSEADWGMGANSSPAWSLCKAELPAWKNTACPAGKSRREVWLPSKGLQVSLYPSWMLTQKTLCATDTEISTLAEAIKSRMRAV